MPISLDRPTMHRLYRHSSPKDTVIPRRSHINHVTHNMLPNHPNNHSFVLFALCVDSPLQQGLHFFHVADTSHVTFLDTLQGQSGNQGSTNTRTVLGSHDDDLVLLVRSPVQDLTESLGTTGLEVRVLGEDRTVGTNVARFDVLLGADGGDTAGRDTGGTSADQLGQTADHLKLRLCRTDIQLTLEKVMSLGQVLVRVLLNGSKERRIQQVRLVQLGGVLAVEDQTRARLEQVQQSQTENLAQVQASGHLLERLLAGTRRVTVDDLVELG